MKINRDNYESFFLDFLEGKLKENQIDEFLDFLEQNQDLKDELHQFESVHLPEEQILFTDKGKLYKSDSEQKVIPENKLIAYLEGDLEKEERIRFEAYLASHQELQKEYNLFARTRLIPESGIRMTDKHKLYRKSGLCYCHELGFKGPQRWLFCYGASMSFIRTTINLKGKKWPCRVP